MCVVSKSSFESLKFPGEPKVHSIEVIFLLELVFLMSKIAIRDWKSRIAWDIQLHRYLDGYRPGMHAMLAIFDLKLSVHRPRIGT
jgi:hypothetical protein